MPSTAASSTTRSKTIPAWRPTASKSKARTRRPFCFGRSIDVCPFVVVLVHVVVGNRNRLARTRTRTTTSGGSQSLQSFQVCKNQLRQFPAVTALQNAECRNAQAAHGLSEPVEVLHLERLLRDRVPRVSVKPG